MRAKLLTENANNQEELAHSLSIFGIHQIYLPHIGYGFNATRKQWSNIFLGNTIIMPTLKRILIDNKVPTGSNISDTDAKHIFLTQRAIEVLQQHYKQVYTPTVLSVVASTQKEASNIKEQLPGLYITKQQLQVPLKTIRSINLTKKELAEKIMEKYAHIHNISDINKIGQEHLSAIKKWINDRKYQNRNIQQYVDNILKEGEYTNVRKWNTHIKEYLPSNTYIDGEFTETTIIGLSDNEMRNIISNLVQELRNKHKIIQKSSDPT